MWILLFGKEEELLDIDNWNQESIESFTPYWIVIVGKNKKKSTREDENLFFFFCFTTPVNFSHHLMRAFEFIFSLKVYFKKKTFKAIFWS